MLHLLTERLGMLIGWMFSPAWLPPKDFDFFHWLFVPGYGYGFILVTLAILEFLIPQERRRWTRSTLLSGTYLLLAGKMVIYVFIVTPLFRNAWVYFGLPSAHLDRTLPLPVYMVVSVVVVTFTGYWAHRGMHQIPGLWHIHKIHHAAQNLNWTSIYQKHFLELLINEPLHLITVLALGTDLVSPFGIIFMLIDVLGHANIRVDLGRLAYVVSTPQAHRIHHSIDARHYDTNFGNTLMLWDHLFGTFHYDPHALPMAYGVDEKIPLSFWKQQVMPLVWIARDAYNAAGKYRSQVRGQVRAVGAGD